jgi:ABC-type nickel/cobalt efflux system permease component RcnA
MKPLHAFSAVVLLLLVIAVVALRAWAGADLGGQVDLAAVWFTAVGAWMIVALALGGTEWDDEAADAALESAGLTALRGRP